MTDDPFDFERAEHFSLRETSRCKGYAREDRWRPMWERRNLVTVEVRAGRPDEPTI